MTKTAEAELLRARIIITRDNWTFDSVYISAEHGVWKVNFAAVGPLINPPTHTFPMQITLHPVNGRSTGCRSQVSSWPPLFASNRDAKLPSGPDRNGGNSGFCCLHKERSLNNNPNGELFITWWEILVWIRLWNQCVITGQKAARFTHLVPICPVHMADAFL